MKEKNKIFKKICIVFGISTFALISLIFLVILLKKDYKISKVGNNLNNKNLQDVEEYILNISSYKAKITVNINSNKNKTQYIIRQMYAKPNIEKQVVEEPSNIKGLETIYDGNSLRINNTSLNANKIYENYSYITKNYLWLNSFIDDYKQEKNKEIYEKDNQIVMEVKFDGKEPYISNEKLIIDKEKGSISKLIVQDKQQKDLVYILYNEIEVNNTKKNDIVAFKLQGYNIAQY